jgi:hypothetical protein
LHAVYLALTQQLQSPECSSASSSSLFSVVNEARQAARRLCDLFLLDLGTPPQQPSFPLLQQCPLCGIDSFASFHWTDLAVRCARGHRTRLCSRTLRALLLDADTQQQTQGHELGHRYRHAYCSLCAVSSYVLSIDTLFEWLQEASVVEQCALCGGALSV